MRALVAGVAIPESELTAQAIAFVARDLPKIFVGHAYRVFLFASLMGRTRKLDFSDELLFVAAVFQHYGLTSRFAASSRRFELDSAEAAAEFLRNYGVAGREGQIVRDAIALHMTFGLDGFDSSVINLLRAGVETDLMALHFDEIAERDRRAVVEAYPRGRAFNSLFIESIADGMMQRPATSFGNVTADILERCDPDFYRTNFCGLILGSRWDDERNGRPI